AIELAHGDPHLGAEVAGFSPLLAAQYSRLSCIGYTRDPASALRELPRVRRFALDSGYPEVAVWVSGGETNFAYLLSSHEEGRALAQAAVRLAENLGVANQILAALALSDAFACECNWQSLLDTANETFRLIQERGALRSV